MITPRRLWNWCRRIRHRGGFGVQSPTDFFLVTSVIYEKRPYYAYRTLQMREYDGYLPHYRPKVNRLLFRLVNFYQPTNLIEFGRENGASFDYMCAANRKMKAYAVRSRGRESSLNELQQRLEKIKQVDCLHIGHTPYYKEVYEKAILYGKAETWFIVAGIHESEEKRFWWRQIQKDERTGLTFDLFDIGLVFFDRKRYKEHYIINFL
ncbi:hypothetical protein [Phocaeicola abscessus]|uniref:hypothetical protein n=1 Tax=Phocaeicola abscessus TaxID=555313 RepID=UPI0003858A26|nr:hypothetical protein [Phocaeicola abscessus]EPT34503.1 hypothetical protein HMPREF9012_0373 [Bacteroidetes bacterium oral taxon 272 str. F0290]